jgi:hypothetical protein
MGTRSLTFVHDGDAAKPLTCMYRQYDGYPPPATALSCSSFWHRSRWLTASAAIANISPTAPVVWPRR